MFAVPRSHSVIWPHFVSFGFKRSKYVLNLELDESVVSDHTPFLNDFVHLCQPAKLCTPAWHCMAMLLSLPLLFSSVLPLTIK